MNRYPSNDAYMTTFMGVNFYPLDPREDEILIDDIAHSLALQCRFNGHCKKFLSTAEHSLHIANVLSDSRFYYVIENSTIGYLVKDCLDKELMRKLALTGLLHDASETYFADLVRPLKEHMPEYSVREKTLGNFILNTFGIDDDFIKTYYPIVKLLDNIMLVNERNQNMNTKVGEGWAVDTILNEMNVVPPVILLKYYDTETVENMFIQKFYELY